jgi:hypothetical protein
MLPCLLIGIGLESLGWSSTWLFRGFVVHFGQFVLDGSCCWDSQVHFQDIDVDKIGTPAFRSIGISYINATRKFGLFEWCHYGFIIT